MVLTVFNLPGHGQDTELEGWHSGETMGGKDFTSVGLWPVPDFTGNDPADLQEPCGEGEADLHGHDK